MRSSKCSTKNEKRIKGQTSIWADTDHWSKRKNVDEIHALKNGFIRILSCPIAHSHGILHLWSPWGTNRQWLTQEVPCHRSTSVLPKSVSDYVWLPKIRRANRWFHSFLESSTHMPLLQENLHGLIQKHASQKTSDRRPSNQNASAGRQLATI